MRRAPSDRPVKMLFASSRGLCAFPGCSTQIVEASSKALLGEMCHIRGASPGGPRFDPAQSDNVRNEVGNLMILCPTHHSLVDQDLATLLAIKSQHEAHVAAILESAISDLGDRQAMDLVRQVEDESVDFAIVVALPKELSAVRKFFPELVRVSHKSSSTRTYYRGTVPTAGGGSYRIVPLP